MNYYTEIPKSLEGVFKEIEKKRYNPYWELKEKLVAVIQSKDEKYQTDYVRCDLIIKLVEEHVKNRK